MRITNLACFVKKSDLFSAGLFITEILKFFPNLIRACKTRLKWWKVSMTPQGVVWQWCLKFNNIYHMAQLRAYFPVIYTHKFLFVPPRMVMEEKQNKNWGKMAAKKKLFSIIISRSFHLKQQSSQPACLHHPKHLQFNIHFSAILSTRHSGREKQKAFPQNKQNIVRHFSSCQRATTTTSRVTSNKMLLLTYTHTNVENTTQSREKRNRLLLWLKLPSPPLPFLLQSESLEWDYKLKSVLNRITFESTFSQAFSDVFVEHDAASDKIFTKI